MVYRTTLDDPGRLAARERTETLDNIGDAPFERGNLDAGRLSWLLGREVVAATDPFDSMDYEALLKIDEAVARASFPDAFDPGWTP